MKVFKFLPPYTAQGRTTFPQSKDRSGVYLIKENGKIVYVGYSAKNLYKTMYRHFQTWNHFLQEIVSYKDRLKKNKYTVRVIFCTPNQAARLERMLIVKLKPRDNAVKYSLYEFFAKDREALAIYEETPVSPDLPF